MVAPTLSNLQIMGVAPVYNLQNMGAPTLSNLQIMGVAT